MFKNKKNKNKNIHQRFFYNMKQICSLFGPDNAEMAPKRPKGRTYYPTVLFLYGLLKSQIDQPEQDGAIRLGGYCSRPGPFPAVIRQWLPTLQALLSACPSALISWSRLKAAFRKLFEEKPSSDPHLKSAEFTPPLSAEECATALRNLCYGLRRCVLYPEKRSLPEEFDALLALITDVAGHDSSSVAVAPAESSKALVAPETPTAQPVLVVSSPEQPRRTLVPHLSGCSNQFIPQQQSIDSSTSIIQEF